jgi:hypothetical protein
MSTEHIKEVLHRHIEEADDRFLRVMYAMAEAYVKEQEEEALAAQIENVPPHPDWKAKTKEELAAELKEADEQIEQGEYTTLEDLEKEMEQW